jgi:hypothetical protein
MSAETIHAGWTVKDEIRAKKKARKVAIRDGVTPEPEPIPTTPEPLVMAPALDPVPEPATPAPATPPPATPAPKPVPPGPGRNWACRACRTTVKALHIPGGWMSISRWPPDRARQGPIVHTFCGPKCAGTYLKHVTDTGANVQYPTLGVKQAARARRQERMGGDRGPNISQGDQR